MLKGSALARLTRGPARSPFSSSYQLQGLLVSNRCASGLHPVLASMVLNLHRAGQSKRSDHMRALFEVLLLQTIHPIVLSLVIDSKNSSKQPHSPLAEPVAVAAYEVPWSPIVAGLREPTGEEARAALVTQLSRLSAFVRRPESSTAARVALVHAPRVSPVANRRPKSAALPAAAPPVKSIKPASSSLRPSRAKALAQVTTFCDRCCCFGVENGVA